MSMKTTNGLANTNKSVKEAKIIKNSQQEKKKGVF